MLSGFVEEHDHIVLLLVVENDVRVVLLWSEELSGMGGSHAHRDSLESDSKHALGDGTVRSFWRIDDKNRSSFPKLNNAPNYM